MAPLSGIRVVELDGLGPVTLSGMMLADLGADVIRLTRADGASAFADVGGAILHRGRTAVPVDLKRADQLAAVRTLVGQADALIEGFRPGVAERLGLGPEACHALNPRLVYGRVTGWGQSGPLAPTVGHDINYLALTGALHAMGAPDRPPHPPLNLVADYGGGAMLLVNGLLAGLIEAQTTGSGRVVDAAMVDGVSTLSSLFHALGAVGLWSQARGSNLLDGSAHFYRCYGCADAGFVAVGALEPRFYAALLAGLELDPAEAPQYPPALWPELSLRFADIFATRSRDDWTRRFEGTEACVTPVLSFAEARDHPHLRGRGTFTGSSVAPQPSPVFDGERATPTPSGAATLETVLAAWQTR